jgi:hypothetical protein
MGRLVRHRQTKEAATDRPNLRPPRHISTLLSSGDIEPDAVANTLTVRIHRMASPVHDRAIAALLEELTRQEFLHPETGAKMTFALV